MKEQKVNVAVVMAWYAPYRVPLFRELAKRDDIDLTVIYCSDLEAGREWRLSSELPFPALFLEPRRITTFAYKDYFGESAPIDYPKGLMRILRRLNPQVVVAYEFHLECMISAAYAAMSRAAYVTWSDVTQLQDARMGKSRMLMRKLLLSRSHALIGSSSDTINHFCEDFGFPRSRAFLSILSSHLDDFLRSLHGSPPRSAEDRDLFRLLYVGRLLPCKGLDVLIKAFSSFTRVFDHSLLTIVGTGPEKENLIRLGSQLGCIQKIAFIDHVPHDSMAAEMARHDLFVFPTRIDVFGLVVAEAMACGLPVICSRNAGAANDLVKGTGIVVEPDKPEDLAAALRLMATNPMMRKKISTAGQRVLRVHSLEAAVDGFLNAIHMANQGISLERTARI